MDKMFYEHMCFGSEYSLIMNEYMKISEKKKTSSVWFDVSKGDTHWGIFKFHFYEKKTMWKESTISNYQKIFRKPCNTVKKIDHLSNFAYIHKGKKWVNYTIF